MLSFSYISALTLSVDDDKDNNSELSGHDAGAWPAPAATLPSARGGASQQLSSPVSSFASPDDVNIQLTGSPSWGSNPPLLQSYSPAMLPTTKVLYMIVPLRLGQCALIHVHDSQASVRNRVLALGSIQGRNPRDRPFVSTASPPRRLPAPQYPAAFGHGAKALALRSPVSKVISPLSMQINDLCLQFPCEI